MSLELQLGERPVEGEWFHHPLDRPLQAGIQSPTACSEAQALNIAGER
jgi:hypothetical protein